MKQSFIVLFIIALFSAGCGLVVTDSGGGGGGGGSGTTGYYISGTANPVYQSGADVAVDDFAGLGSVTIFATDLVVSAYNLSNYTGLAKSTSVPSRGLGVTGSLPYKLSGLTGNKVYYLKASQLISVNFDGIPSPITYQNMGTRVVSLEATNLTVQDITLLVSILNP
ncbi:MAG: hypothetical protein V1843_05260 [bacterium]